MANKGLVKLINMVIWKATIIPIWVNIRIKIMLRIMGGNKKCTVRYYSKRLITPILDPIIRINRKSRIILNLIFNPVLKIISRKISYQKLVNRNSSIKIFLIYSMIASLIKNILKNLITSKL